MEIKRTIINEDIFPTYSKWDKFLSNIHGYRQDSKHSSMSYRSNKGIINTIKMPRTFITTDHFSHIIQDYQDPNSEFGVHTVLRDNYLTTELRLLSKMPENINFISIVSQSFLSPVYNDQQVIGIADERVASGYKLSNKPAVFLRLEDKYLSELKSEGIIPDYFTKKIWIKPDELSGQLIAESEISKPNFSTESLLNKIREDLGLIFDIKTKEGVTEGNYGDMHFSVAHTNPLSLDQDSVWSTLTGSDPDKLFFFPISVTKGGEKII